MTRTALLLADRYELQEPVGRGGMSVVHRGWDRRLDRPVAIKVFRTEVSGAAESMRRRSETQLLASLHHPSLVTLFDAVSAEDATFLVMELVEGPTLRQWLQRSVLPLEVAAAMASTLAEGLHFIHERGIVHRDVKPANVLLAPSPIPGRPPLAKLSDFGIARLIESDRVTSTGTFVGTAHYLSPEQARGEPVGPPSDVYSLGLTLLEAVTGATPFPGSPLESATARLVRDPDVPGSLGYGWKSLLTAMTRRNPAQRATALDVVLRAQALLQGDVEPVPTEPAAPTRRAARRDRAVAAPPVPVRAAPTPPAPAAPAPATQPVDELAPTRTLTPDELLHPLPAFEPLATTRPAEATTVFATAASEPDVVARARAAAGVAVGMVRPAAARARALAGAIAAVVGPALAEAVAWVVDRVRRRPMLTLGMAAVAAVLLAVVLLVALMPGAPVAGTAPALPATGEPLHGHLQQLLESVSR